MQDFTKDLGVTSPVKQQPTSLPPSPSNNGWLAKRLNRDNAFNLAFILGVIIGANVINFWLALGLMALALRFLNPVKFENGKFFSSSGREIECNNLKYLFGTVHLSIFCSFAALILFPLEVISPYLHIKYAVFNSFLFIKYAVSLIVFIFFIYNLPFSIVFGNTCSEFLSRTGLEKLNKNLDSPKFDTPKNYASDITYRHLPGNIHHHRW